MENGVLNKFLDAGLLAALGTDNDFKVLQSIADDLGNSLCELPAPLPQFVIAGFDSTLPGNDSVYGVVEAAAKKRWATILNVIGSEPVQTYRAIILGALEVVVAKKPELSPAILLSAANVPVVSYGAREAGPVGEFLANLRHSEEQKTENAWISTQPFTFPKAGSKPRNPNLKAEILAGLTKAAGNTDLAGEPLAGANTSYATATLEWTKFFVETAGDTIFKAIQSGFDQNSAEMRDAAAAIKTEFQAMVSRDAKCELLWLKESGYSPTAMKGFREMTDIEVLFYTVLDVSRIVGNSCAPSIEWFLHDLMAFRGDTEVAVKSTVEGFRPLLKGSGEAALVSEPTASAGRRSLWEIAVIPHETASFEEQSGLAAGFKETLPNLARRLFREIQALKIVTGE